MVVGSSPTVGVMQALRRMVVDIDGMLGKRSTMQCLRKQKRCNSKVSCQDTASCALRLLTHMGPSHASQARLAQSVERKALNLVVVGSSPTVGVTAAKLCVCLPLLARVVAG